MLVTCSYFARYCLRYLNDTFKVAHRMQLALRQLELPQANLRTLTDAERRIPGGAVWCLATIQRMLASETVTVSFSKKAEESAVNELFWSVKNAKTFIQHLHAGRYNKSEWCYTTKGNTPFASDSYCMGFNRHKGEENQRVDPWVYFKFSVNEKTKSILILSAHPEGQYER